MSTISFRKGPIVHWSFVVGLACGLLAVVLLPIVSQAQSVDPPPRPTPALPPRPTPVPAEPQASHSRPPEGGYIELDIDPVRRELWTVVQWQDSYGNWHDVEGWQGTPREEQKTVLWWVAKKDLSTGPFRWVIHACRGCRIVATSGPFYLPNSAGQRLVVDVSFWP